MNMNLNNLKQVNELFELMKDAASKQEFLAQVIAEKEAAFKCSSEMAEKYADSEAKIAEAGKVKEAQLKKLEQLKLAEGELAQKIAAHDANVLALQEGKTHLAKSVLAFKEEVAAHAAHVALKEAELASKLKQCEDIKVETLATKEALDAKLEQLRKTIEG
jgi:chromosome segregation ATPase